MSARDGACFTGIHRAGMNPEGSGTPGTNVPVRSSDPVSIDAIHWVLGCVYPYVWCISSSILHIEICTESLLFRPMYAQSGLKEYVSFCCG